MKVRVDYLKICFRPLFPVEFQVILSVACPCRRLNECMLMLDHVRTNINLFPSGKSFFPDAEIVGFLSGNEKFFLFGKEIKQL